jgi:hypothetical protein
MLQRFRDWVRDAPAVPAYVGILVALHLILDHAVPKDDAASFAQYVSTNVDNLTSHPVVALVGSAFILDSTLSHVLTVSFAGTLITFVAGLVVVLHGLERRLGALRAFGVFVVGHVGATLTTALIIEVAVAHHVYPSSVRSAHDVGISYGAQAALGCGVVLFLRGWQRVACAGLVLAWPLANMGVVGGLPDFTTFGHLAAALLGFVAGALCVAEDARPGFRRERVGGDGPAGEPVSG